jgi:hypothetical protein
VCPGVCERRCSEEEEKKKKVKGAVFFTPSTVSAVT